MTNFFKPMPTHLEYFEQEGVLVQYGKNQVFVRPEDDNPWVHYLVDGLVEITQATNDGNSRLMGYFFPGVVFAQSGSFLTSHSTELEYVTVHPSSMLRIHRQRFIELLSQDIRFANEYTDLLLRNQFLLMERIAIIGEYNIDRRVARLLVSLARYYGHQEDQVYLADIPVTQETIARFTHSTRESASKTIRKLTRDKIISINNKVLTIIDMDRLLQYLDT